MFNWRRDISINRREGEKDGGDVGRFINLKTESWKGPIMMASTFSAKQKEISPDEIAGS